MPKMIALKRRRYDSKLVNVNDVFDVRSKDVRLLKAMKWAMDYIEPPSAIVVTPFVETVTTQAEEPQVLPDPVLVESEPIEEYIDVNVEAEATQEVTTSEEPKQTPDHIFMLRKRAAALGINVDGRWSYTRLQREIDEYNKRTYQRADLRAEE